MHIELIVVTKMKNTFHKNLVVDFSILPKHGKIKNKLQMYLFINLVLLICFYRRFVNLKNSSAYSHHFHTQPIKVNSKVRLRKFGLYFWKVCTYCDKFNFWEVRIQKKNPLSKGSNVHIVIYWPYCLFLNCNDP